MRQDLDLLKGYRNQQHQKKRPNAVGSLIKYELVQIDPYRSSTGQQWNNMQVYDDIKGRPGAYVQGTALAQLITPRKLKFEAFPGKAVAQVTGFAASAIMYER